MEGILPNEFPFSSRFSAAVQPRTTKAKANARSSAKRRRPAATAATVRKQVTRPVEEEVEVQDVAIELSAAVVVPPLGVAAALPMILQAAGASIETELAPVPTAALPEQAPTTPAAITVAPLAATTPLAAPAATATATRAANAEAAPAAPATRANFAPKTTAPVINIRRVTTAAATAAAVDLPAAAPLLNAPTIPFAARPISATASIEPQAQVTDLPRLADAAPELRAGYKGPDRRKSPRQPLRARAIYRSDRDPAAAGPVQLLDVSTTGARLWSPRTVKLGERGNVKMELGPVRFSNRVKIVSCESNDEGFTVGCEFASSEITKRSAA